MKRLSEQLQKVESEVGCSIIAAWETGSRAYNFAHSESDNDVSVVYIQPRESYILSDEYTKGFASEQLDSTFPDEIEIDGWDIKRFRELILEYDPMILEALYSPVPYKAPIQMTKLAEHIDGRIHPITLFNQYQSAAESMFRQRVVNGKVENKYLFHILRNVLFARYIEETHQFPPLDFQKFITQAPNAIFKEVSRDYMSELLNYKQDSSASSEMVEFDIDSIVGFFEYELEYQSHIPEETINESYVNSQVSEMINLF